jgi:hypothetical protein
VNNLTSRRAAAAMKSALYADAFIMGDRVSFSPSAVGKIRRAWKRSPEGQAFKRARVREYNTAYKRTRRAK